MISIRLAWDLALNSDAWWTREEGRQAKPLASAQMHQACAQKREKANSVLNPRPLNASTVTPP